MKHSQRGVAVTVNVKAQKARICKLGLYQIGRLHSVLLHVTSKESPSEELCPVGIAVYYR